MAGKLELERVGQKSNRIDVGMAKQQDLRVARRILVCCLHIPPPPSELMIDAKSLRQQSLDTQDEIRQTTPIRTSNYERAQFAAMDNMGLVDGDDALQYALMLSMDEQDHSEISPSEGHTGAGNSSETNAGVDADAELQEMLEMIRVAEERESTSH